VFNAVDQNDVVNDYYFTKLVSPASN